MKRFLLATVSMVALTSAARTTDMPTKAPIYAPTPIADWTRAYLGIQGGAVRRGALAELGLFGFELDGSKTGGTAGAVTSISARPTSRAAAPRTLINASRMVT
jgi:opacity protein-like surface antigen